MFARLPRRKRLLWLTAGIAVVFLAAVAGVLWAVLRPAPTYRPGETIAGLTAELARTLPSNHPRVAFADVTSEAGITFQHFSGTRSSQLPEDMGSGAAWGDYDNDGWLDLIVVNEVGPITLSAADAASSAAHAALFHNNADGTFTEVSAQAGVDHHGWGMGAGWGDYNNDGRLDLFISAYGENVFYHNNGDGTFTDRTIESGLGGRRGFWTGVSWADFNRDGFLDLYVGGYVRYQTQAREAMSLHYDVEEPASINPSSFEPESNLLYRNNGDGSFTEMAEQAGVGGERGRTLEAAWSDLDEDGWPDLYVANDVSDNVLFRNLGNETFADISHLARVADYRGAMGVAVGDWDRDTDMDIVITHWIAQENALFNNQRAQLASRAAAGPPPLQFMDEADRYGLGQIALDYIGWGTSFFDYDNDGWLDLFVVNGSTFQQRDNPRLLVPMRDQLFWNSGAEEGFYDVSSVAGAYLQAEFVGRGAAFGDYDNDGDVDVFVVNNGGPGVLLRNDGGSQNAWLKVRLEGRTSNRSGIGAKLRLFTGTSVQVREVGVQSSYLSQNSLVQHFGLGNHAQADSLVVIWPMGTRDVLSSVPANQTVHVVEGSHSPR